MSIVFDIFSWLCLIGGGFCAIASGIGMLRPGWPDMFARMHAASISDTLAAGLIVIGLALQVEPGMVTIKLMLILVFIFFSSPTSTHALAKAALHDGQKPVAQTRGGSPSKR